MEALSRPLERTVEAAEYFLRTPSLRLLYVATAQVLRESVLHHVCATELLDPCTTPFFVLEGATDAGDDGWTLRAEELRLDWAQLVDSAPAGLLPALWAPEEARTPLERFGLELARALASTRAPITGLTIVLAPVWITDAERWQQQLSIVLGSPSLARARFIVVECDSDATLPLVDGVPWADRVDARVREAELVDAAAARLAGVASAPTGATGARVVGAAGPDVAPPRRGRAAAPPTTETLETQSRALGVPVAYLRPEVMQRFQVLLARATLSARRGDLVEAARAQREVTEHCRAHGLHQEQVACELTLGSYLLQGRQHALALDTYREARAFAHTCGLPTQAVLAQLAAGVCLLSMERFDEAVEAYAEAGHLAVESGAKELAIEAYRTSGQLLAARGFDAQAGAAFRQALAVVEDDPSVGPSSSAPEAARALAALCRKHRMDAQAEALEAQATELEAAPRPTEDDVDDVDEPAGESWEG